MLHFLILAYNEADNLKQLFESLREHLSRIEMDYDIILVNDGSSDETVRVAGEWESKIPVRIVHHGTNLGVAQGFRTGFAAVLATAKDTDTIITLEADNTSDLALLPPMVSKIGAGADVVVASCYGPGGTTVGVPFMRKVMSYAINQTMRLLFPIRNVHTYSSFYRVYRSSVLREATDTFGERFIESSGFTVAAEILFKLRRLGARMEEVPMVLRFNRRKGRSKMKVGRTIMEYISFLGREWKHDVNHTVGAQPRR
jgi:dolichol-phosphate mannosyltransferase